MKLINVGGATAILEHRGKRMLFDPWLDDGIFHGAWYHFPPLQMSIADLGRFDYIYISHIHEDHCSAGTIEHLNRDAELLIVDRQPNFVARFLDANGFRFKQCHLIKPRSEVCLEPGLYANMLEADPANEMAHVIDSALLLRWDGYTIYNANDCHPYTGGLDYIAQTYGKPDLALLPYTGGSGYPSCYTNLSEAQKLEEKARILESRLKGFVDTVRRIDPKFVVPFADQYVVAGSRDELNRYISHPPCPGFVHDRMQEAGLIDRLILLNSGQSYDFDVNRKTPEAPYRFYSEQDRARYAATKKAEAVYDHERFEFSASVALDRLVAYARERLWSMQQRKDYRPRFSFYLEVPESRTRFHLPLDQQAVAQVDWAAALSPPYLKISCSHSLMIMLLLGHVSWNIADAALFLDYERVPNVYDAQLYVYLNYLKI